MPLPINSYGYQSCSIVLEGENIVAQNNEDGTVDVFYIVNGAYVPLELGQVCCDNYMNRLGIDGLPIGDDPIFGSQGQTYSWDHNDSVCRWAKKVDCNNLPTFNVVLNPNGNYGSMFEVQPEETCFIDVTFDYMVKFDCAKLLAIENSVPTQTLNTLYTDLSGYTQQLTELNNAGAPQGVFNNIIINYGYTVPPQLAGLTGYCVTEIGASVYQSLVENNFIGGVSLWEDYLSTGVLPLTQAYINEPELAQSVVDQFLELNTNYNGTLATVCSDFGDLVNETQNWLTDLNQWNSDVTQLETLIADTNSAIETILANNQCLYAIDAIESLNLGVGIDIQTQQESVVDNIYSETFFNIGKGKLFDYLSENSGNTGIYISEYGGIGCNSTDCDLFARKIIPELITEAKSSVTITGTTLPQNISELTNNIGESYFDSSWVRYNMTITDQSVISAMTGNNINLSIQVNNSCVDFSILIDRVQLRKVCDRHVRNDIFISDNVGFDLTKEIDNRKSWVANDTEVNRSYSLEYRNTDYNEKNEKLVINTKEVDINLSIARGIETDVWCYINDNQCILSGCSEPNEYTDCCCVDTIVSGTSITGGTVILPPSSSYTCNHVVGQSGPAGGIVFWVHPNNPCIAMEVTPTDISNIEWNPWSAQYVGGTYTAFGYGQSNTQQIVNAIQPNNAAYTANTYSLNGYDDWYLPSIDELKYLYDVITGLSGSSSMSNVYWSSSEYNTNYAYYLFNGVIHTTQYGELTKRAVKGVRAIRNINTSNCSSIYDAITGSTYSTFSIESHPCYDIYKVNSGGTMSAFTGYWFANMPDGTLGVFNHVTTPSGTTTTVNYSNTVTQSCCESYAEAFEILESNLNIGDHLFKPYWDHDCQRCSVRRCEDLHCVDFSALTSNPFTGYTTVENFNDFISSELINARCRKISTEYPTLNALYRRYMQSDEFCDGQSSMFDYSTMLQFSDLIGTYWIDMFEQVIPATTIWSSAYVLKNTLFDAQKYVYRSGTVSVCGPNELIPVPPASSGATNVDYYVYDSDLICQDHQYCDNIYYYNGDCGSEFIGSVTIETTDSTQQSGEIITNE